MSLHCPGGLLHSTLGFNMTPLARVRAANFMRVTEAEGTGDVEVEIRRKKQKV